MGVATRVLVGSGILFLTPPPALPTNMVDFGIYPTLLSSATGSILPEVAATAVAAATIAATMPTALPGYYPAFNPKAQFTTATVGGLAPGSTPKGPWSTTTGTVASLTVVRTAAVLTLSASPVLPACSPLALSLVSTGPGCLGPGEVGVVGGV